MKYSIVAILLLGICASTFALDSVCYTHVEDSCNNLKSFDGASCNARYGGIAHAETDVSNYFHTQISKSYTYLLLATFFNSYQKNRPGFNKLYQGLSDRSFDESIDLIKQITRRGGIVNFSKIHERIDVATVDVNELQSLALALDAEKHLAERAIHLHTKLTHSQPRDPELSQYLEEKFLGSQAESVRKLSGYANDLAKIVNQQDPSLGIYLFDEFLKKQ